MNATTENNWLRASLLMVVLAHLAVALWHGATHLHIPVPLTTLQSAFVGVVIVLLPLVGAGLLWTSWKWWAALLIAASMLGSLLFGLVNHYVLDSPDHVLAVPEHQSRPAFVLTAALLVVTETMGAVLGTIATIKWRREQPRWK
jgi:hypothetical protein